MHVQKGGKAIAVVGTKSLTRSQDLGTGIIINKHNKSVKIAGKRALWFESIGKAHEHCKHL